MDIEKFREYCLSLPCVTEDFPFDETVLVFRVKNKIFACVCLDKPELGVLKCDPEYAVELRDHYMAIEPAWHWNKQYWNQILFNRDVTDEFLCKLINHSFAEVVKKLPKKEQTDELKQIK
ncbi:MAG: MmcQ/YjbR family DNA-binding protein [Bacteroidales bacterium]|nr:MmcQ/YjbR family DNA-binding protein [Bacteroidales bacterium]